MRTACYWTEYYVLNCKSHSLNELYAGYAYIRWFLRPYITILYHKAKFRNLLLKIIEDYLKDRYALITDLTDGEKVFVHKISLSITGESRSKVYSIDATPSKEIKLEKDRLRNTRKETWHGLDDVANLRTNSNFYNIMFVDIAPTTVKKVRLKLKGKRDE